MQYTWFGVMAGGLLLAIATGCQPSGPKSVSLEEAKQATTSFEAETPVVPPRRVDDILSILDDAPRAGGKELDELRRMVAEQPPAGGSERELARFHYDRAIAARRLGLLTQHVEDAELAYRYAKSVHGDGVIFAENRAFLSTVAFAEWLFGDKERGKAHFATYERFGTGPHDRVDITGTLTMVHAFTGNITEAERYLREFEAAYPRADRRNFWTRFRWEQTHATYLLNVGRFEEAAAYFERMVQMIPDADAAQDLLVLLWSDYATALLGAGRLVDAEVVARDAIKASIRYAGTLSAIANDPILVLADVLVAQGRTEESTLLVQRAMELYESSGASPDSEEVRDNRLRLAQALAAKGDWTGSRSMFETLQQTGSSMSFVDEQMRRSAVYPMVMIETGSVSEAIPLLRESAERMSARVGEKHGLTAELNGILAVATARAGQHAEALRLFRASIPSLVSRSREMQRAGSEATASERTITYILVNYLRLLADIHGTAIETASGINAIEESFQISDIARSRTVQQAINATAARATASDPALADLARREQDAQAQVSALYLMLSRASDAAASDDLRARIDTLRSARAALMEEIERRYPTYASLINPTPLSIADAKALLRPGEALVSLYVGPKETYVWAVSADSVAFERVALGAAEIDGRISTLRKALNPAASTLGDIPPFDVAAAHDLYKAVLEPVSATWKSSEALVIVPHGALAQLPFSLLPTAAIEVDQNVEPLFAGYRSVPWLARDHAVVTVPSTSAFAALRRLPAPNQARTQLAAFGDPVFGPDVPAAEASGSAQDALTARGLLAVRGLPVKLRAAPGTESSASALLAMLPRLPETADEVRGIAVALTADPTASVFLGSDASEQRVKTMNLSDRRVLVFATHGLVPGDLDGLTQPALALSNPALSRDGGDGLLTMGEVLALKLDADWVVLSACNTAAGEGAGSEAISGLGRAFLYAGARALLVSNWPVETTSTRILTTDIFNRQAGDQTLTRAVALQQSMLGLIDGPGYLDETGSAVFSYAHPIFWAPFALVGDGS